MKRLPVKKADGSIALVEKDSIFYLEAEGDDTLIRTRRNKPYRSVQPMHELAGELSTPPFIHCHREFIVNLDRVSALVPRSSRDYDFRLDPPVNRRIPIGRDRLAEVRKILGV